MLFSEVHQKIYIGFPSNLIKRFGGVNRFDIENGYGKRWNDSEILPERSLVLQNKQGKVIEEYGLIGKSRE